MKKCEYFKDLILTDYIDGELDKDSVQGMESHLRDCNDCRIFLKEVKNNAEAPFQQALRQPVPAELWDMVKQNIEHEWAFPRETFIDKLKGLIVFPKLVPVFASLMLMFLAGSITFNTIQIQRAQEKDQGEYLVSLLGPTSSSLQGENNDLGTPIEHYFL
jgi:hypothetical protein